jgi:hypothetical protein
MHYSLPTDSIVLMNRGLVSMRVKCYLVRVWDKNAAKAVGPLPRRVVNLGRSQEASQVTVFLLVSGRLVVLFPLSVPLPLNPFESVVLRRSIWPGL